MAQSIEAVKERREQRVNLRLPASVKQTLERAAEIAGLSLTDYILAHTLEAAREDIARALRRRLSERDTAALLAILEGEGEEPAERMKEAIERYNRLVAGVRE